MNFIDFARINGVLIDPNRLYASDKIKRCGTVDKPGSGNGAYFWDGERGWVFNWAGEARTIWFEDPKAKPWTAEEKRLWAVRKASAVSDQDRIYEQSALKAEAIMRSAKLDHHPYLEIKGFKDMRGMVIDDKLLIPMRNVVTNKLQGYQSIYWDEPNRSYEKKMMLGMRAKNAVLYLGTRDLPECWLVEGFSTGLSLRHALRSVGLAASVVVCFSASNLIQVADQIPGKRFVYADQDQNGVGESAAKKTGLPYAISDVMGNDANDDHKQFGLFHLVNKIMKVRIGCL